MLKSKYISSKYLKMKEIQRISYHYFYHDCFLNIELLLHCHHSLLKKEFIKIIEKNGITNVKEK